MAAAGREPAVLERGHQLVGQLVEVQVGEDDLLQAGRDGRLDGGIAGQRRDGRDVAVGVPDLTVRPRRQHRQRRQQRGDATPAGPPRRGATSRGVRSSGAPPWTAFRRATSSSSLATSSAVAGRGVGSQSGRVGRGHGPPCDAREVVASPVVGDVRRADRGSCCACQPREPTNRDPRVESHL